MPAPSASNISYFFPQQLCFGSPFLRPCECRSRIVQLVRMHGPQHREGEEKREKPTFSLQILGKKSKTLIFEFPRSSRVDWYRNFRFSSYPDPFRRKSSFFSTVFEDFQRFPKVSKGFRRIPRVSDGFRGFPKVSEGFRRFPKVFNFSHFSTFLDPFR